MDFSELEFIDSTGLGAVISVFKHASEVDGDVYIANLQPKQRMVFDITRAYRIFDVYKSLGSQGYQHERIIISGSVMKAHELLKWVHIIAGNAKAWINGTFHGIDRKHLQSYLDEFFNRLNRRFYETELLDRVITACANSSGITLADLYG